MHKVLLTCPPMAKILEEYNILRHTIQKHRHDIKIPEFEVVISEN